MHHAALLMENQHARRVALRNALGYPTFLVVVGATTVMLLVVFVFPRIAQMLADLGQDVPASTRWLIFVGHALSRWSVLIIIVFALAAAGVRELFGRRSSRRWIHRGLLRVPIVGGIRNASATSRFCLAVGAMLEEGLSVTRVLTIADQVVGDDELRSRLRSTRDLVIAGESLATAVRKTELLTRTATMMIAAGEIAGNLPSMLRNASMIEATRAEQRLRTVTKFVEPGLVLVLGGAVMFVAAALLQAVYSIAPIE